MDFTAKILAWSFRILPHMLGPWGTVMLLGKQLSRLSSIIYIALRTAWFCLKLLHLLMFFRILCFKWLKVLTEVRIMPTVFSPVTTSRVHCLQNKGRFALLFTPSSKEPTAGFLETTLRLKFHDRIQAGLCERRSS